MDIKNWPMLRLLKPLMISQIKRAYVFGTSGSEAIIVTKYDGILAFGMNEAGCLGLGKVGATLSPRKIEAFRNKRVKGFAFGNGPFAVAVTESGEVYSWGKNDVGQVGNNKSGEDVLTPTLVGGELLEKKVIEIACGGSHTLALTAEGEVYFWGMHTRSCSTNLTGRQYGYTASHGVIINAEKAPKKVNFGTETKKVIAIACGNRSSMALLEDGKLYGWGYNDFGQLGLGRCSDYCHPNPCWISSLKDTVITKIACGYQHTLGVSHNGQLYAWGDHTNEHPRRGNAPSTNRPAHYMTGMGYQGQAISDDADFYPQARYFNNTLWSTTLMYKAVHAILIDRVVDIAAVHNSKLSAVMTENSEVYMWGDCRGINIKVPLKTHFTSLSDVFACCATVTPTKPRVDMNPGTAVAESMRKAFNDPKYSDLTMMVQGQPIHVHKAFLKIRCEHLATTLSERWQEGQTDVCEINIFPYEVYRAFLEYLYTDEVKVPVEYAAGLLDLANSYQEEPLIYKCAEIIERGLTVKNVASVYGSILNYNIKELEESCLKFFVNHKSDVMETEGFKNLDLKVRVELLEKTVKFAACKP